jgi:hypothetical protein
MEHIEKASATVMTAVTFAGTLIGGLGLVATTEIADVGVGWGIPTVVLAAASIVCSVLATVPAAAKVAPGNLVAVEAFFGAQIRRRGMLVRLAGWSLAGALVFAPLPLIVAAVSSARAAVDLDIVVDLNASRALIRASATGIESDAVVTVRVTADDKLLAYAITDADADGTTEASLSVTNLQPNSRLRVSASGPRGVPRRVQEIVIPTAG